MVNTADNSLIMMSNTDKAKCVNNVIITKLCIHDMEQWDINHFNGCRLTANDVNHK